MPENIAYVLIIGIVLVFPDIVDEWWVMNSVLARDDRNIAELFLG